MGKRRGSGEGSIRLRPDGRWEARYTLPDGKRRSIMGKTRTEVARKLTEALRDLDRGIVAPKDERQTLGAYLDSWLVTKKPTVEPGYWRRLEECVRLYIKPSLGKVPLTQLTPQHIQRLYAQLLEQYGVPRVQKTHVALHKALNDALRMDLVARNVADLVDKPKTRHVEMQVYKPEQASQLLAAAQRDRLEALYVLMLTTGCRLGELLGLRWDALNLERRELHVTSVLKEVKGQRSLGEPKTPHSRRTIPLTQLAVDLLRNHHVAQLAEQLKYGPDWNPQQLVFCSTAGTAYLMSNWHRSQYRPLLKRAGLPYIRPHDIRHTAATLLLLDGVPVIVVSRMLGHANVAFTLQTYGHVLAEMREMARDAMERRFSSPVVAKAGRSTSVLANWGQDWGQTKTRGSS